MTCPICDDRGILLQPWTDAPPDYALCLCPAAAWFRRGGWQLWCARWQVAPDRVYRLEEIYSPEDLDAAGLVVEAPPVSLEAALLTASKRRPSKRRPRL